MKPDIRPPTIDPASAENAEMYATSIVFPGRPFAAPLCSAQAGLLPERFSLTPVYVKIEDRDPFVIGGSLKHLRVTKRADRIVVAGVPLLLHAEPGERVVL